MGNCWWCHNSAGIAFNIYNITINQAKMCLFASSTSLLCLLCWCRVKCLMPVCFWFTRIWMSVTTKMTWRTAYFTAFILLGRQGAKLTGGCWVVEGLKKSRPTAKNKTKQNINFMVILSEKSATKVGFSLWRGGEWMSPPNFMTIHPIVVLLRAKLSTWSSRRKTGDY